MNHISEQELKVVIKSGKYTWLEQLYEIIGYPTIIQFLKEFGGDSLYVPTYGRIVKHLRIYQDFLSCGSYKKIAEKYDVSVKTVYNVIKEQQELYEDSG